MLRSVTADMSRDSFFVALTIGRWRLASHSVHVGVPVLVDRLSDVDLVAPATDFVSLGIDEAILDVLLSVHEEVARLGHYIPVSLSPLLSIAVHVHRRDAYRMPASVWLVDRPGYASRSTSDLS